MSPLPDNLQSVMARLGRVGVLMGGISAEREISLKSGEMIFDALVSSGVDAVKLVWNDNLNATLTSEDFDRIFIALHGRGGEDGQVQGLLGLMGIPYTGSDVLGSALAMDKIRSKQIWKSCNIPTPGFLHCTVDTRAKNSEIRQFPVMVKPAREGSSIGISKVAEQDQLQSALDAAFAYDDVVLVEQFVEGHEYTLSILGQRSLPIIRLETPNEFYDYEAKYLLDNTRYHCPSGLDKNIETQCAELGLRAFKALGASGWGRVDFILDQNDNPQFIEVNTVPGMTDHSLVPMAAAAAGIGFKELVIQILAESLEGDKA